jgi:hypothetical protein
MRYKFPKIGKDIDVIALQQETLEAVLASYYADPRYGGQWRKRRAACRRLRAGLQIAGYSQDLADVVENDLLEVADVERRYGR